MTTPYGQGDPFNLLRCECEHIRHADGVPDPGHSYGAVFSEPFLHAVLTDYGVYRVCSDCKNRCLAGYCKEVTE